MIFSPRGLSAVQAASLQPTGHNWRAGGESVSRSREESPVLPRREVRRRWRNSYGRGEPEGRQIVAHGAQPRVAGGRRLPAPERGESRDPPVGSYAPSL